MSQSSGTEPNAAPAGALGSQSPVVTGTATLTPTVISATASPAASATATATQRGNAPTATPSATAKQTPAPTTTPSSTAAATATAVVTRSAALTPTATATLTATTVVSDTEIEVSPTQGGTLRSKDGKLTLDIPPGAVSAAARISHRPLPEITGKKFAYVFELKARGKANGQDLGQFTRPLTLTINIDKLDLSDLANQGPLALFYLDDQTGQWHQVAVVRDPTRNTLSARIEHFSPWSIGENLAMTQEAVPSVRGFSQLDLFAGAASVNYPFTLPPGPAHFQPALSLNYSSNWLNDHRMTGDSALSSFVGEGWSLGGLASISRDVKGTPTDESDDVYHLSSAAASGRLIQGLNGRWHTFEETYAYIWRDGNLWKMKDKSGTLYVFSPMTDYFTLDAGNTCGSERNLTMKWLLTQMTDTHLNTLSINYATASGNLTYRCWNYWYWSYGNPRNYTRAAHPASISYASGAASLTFAYEAKQYYPGCVYQQQQYCDEQRLREVQVFANYGLARNYLVGYGEGDRVSSLTQRARDNVNALPAYTFSYGTIGDDNGLLTLATNGYGGEAEFHYRREDFASVCDDNGCPNNTWYSRWVVANQTLRARNGATVLAQYAASYEYSNPTVHVGGQDGGTRFIGHGWARQTQFASALDTAIVNRSESWFLQRLNSTPRWWDLDPRQGKVYQSQVTDQWGSVYAKTVNNYTYTVVENLGYIPINNINFIRLDDVYQYSCEGTGSCRETRVNYGYDAYGNVQDEYHYGNSAVSGDEQTVHRGFVFNTGDAWILNQPSWENVHEGLIFDRNSSVNLKTQRQYAYDYLAYGSAPTKGDLTFTQRGGAGYLWSASSLWYDGYGNLTTVSDANGHQTTTVYDMILHVLPTQVTNAAAHVTTFEYDYTLAQLTAINDPNGGRTTASYDGFSRRLSVTSPTEQGSGQPTALYTYYDSAPFRVRTDLRNDQGGNIAPVAMALKVFDGLGQLIQQKTPGDSSGWVIVSNMRYNAQGKVERSTLPRQIGADLVGFSDGDWLSLGTQAATSTSYDVLARPYDVTNPDNTVTRYRYTIGRAAVLDANGHQKISDSDAYGRTTRVYEYDGWFGTSVNWGAAAYATTYYAYDVLNNLRSVSDAAGNTTWMSYDSLSRKISMLDPDMGQWWYGYDGVGNLTSQQNANNQTISFGYDVINRLTSKSGPGLSVTYGYDAYDGVSQFGRGQRTSMTDGSGSTTWTYDRRGRVTQESKTITGAGTFNTSLTYDAADRVRTLTYPDGEVVTNGYSDPRGVLNTVSGWSSYVNSSSYNALGQVTQQSYNGWNSSSASWSYRSDNFRLDNYQVNSAWYGNQLNLSYSYDAVGNVKTISDGSNSNQVQTFTYDALNRLTSASTNAVGNGQYSESYSYNPIGNLTSKSDLGSYSYPPSGANSVRPHAVTSVGGYSYSYDANGNMLTRTEWSGSHTQGWDVENHLTSDSNGANSVTFTYDGDSKRVKKVDNGVTTAYIANLYEWKSSGGVVKYYYAAGKRVAMRTSSSIWDVSYLFGDHLGSTSLATNAYGYQTSRLSYKPFGGTAWFTAVLPTDYGFTGQRYEGTTGYIYDFGARYYDEYIGRFISADTIVPGAGNPQALNRYSYVFNNPLKYTDPTGHCPVCGPSGAAGAAYQFINDMTFGVPNLVFGTGWQDEQSPEFQRGQEIGRDISLAVSTAIAIDGVAKGLAGLTAMPPTAAAAVACAEATAGTCAVPGSAALVAEGGLVLQGLSEALYGSNVILYSKSAPIHHIATNKNWIRGQQWSKQFKELFDKGGLDLNDSINKLALPGHTGPHSEAYHKLVYARLKQAIEGLSDTSEIRAALEAELKALAEELRANPGLINTP